ncbi:MAG: hypothetical protein ACJAS1_004713 [Oleiphilaceae bacterium]|jgi:hypothetical protein
MPCQQLFLIILGFNMTQQKIIEGIGLPLTRKTTTLQERFPEYFIISGDKTIEQTRAKYGLTFSQFFQKNFNDPIRQEQRQLFSQIVEYSKDFKKIAWDLTNLSKKDRAKVMGYYPEAEFTAVVFEFEGYEEEIIQLNYERGLSTGKVIPKKVIINMIKNYEPVTKKEGFSEIITLNTIPSIIAFENAA